MAYSLDEQDDANLTEEERKRKSAASNQTPGVKQGNQVGQTASGSPLGDLIAPFTNNTGANAQQQNWAGGWEPVGNGGSNPMTPGPGVYQKPGSVSAPQTTTPPTTANTPTTQATAKPATYNVGPADPKVAQSVASIIQAKGLKANQSDPASLQIIVDELNKQGIKAQVDYKDENGHTGGILVDGKPYQLIDGSNNWTSLQPWQDSGASGGWSPSYQSYFGGPGQGMGAMNASSISQYKAGTVPQFQGTKPPTYQPGSTITPYQATPVDAYKTGSTIDPFQAQAAPVYQPGSTIDPFQAQNAPTYAAGSLNQYAAPDLSASTSTMQQLLSRIMGQSAPNTAGMKESQKELLNQLRADQNSAIDQNAAARGVSGGNPAALHANVDDAFASDLTKSYRDIDTQAQQQEFENLLNSLSAAQNVATTQSGLAQSNYQTGLQGQTAQEALKQAAAASGQNAAQLNQSNYTTGLQGTQLQEAIRQAAAASGQNAAQLNQSNYTTGLQGTQLAEALRQAEAASKLNVAQQHQADYTTGLQGTQLMEALRQAAAASGQNAAQIDQSNYTTGLQGTQLQEALRQAEAASGQGAAGLGLQGQSLLQQWLLGQRGMDLTQRGQDIGVDQFGRSLDSKNNADYMNYILGLL